MKSNRGFRKLIKPVSLFLIASLLWISMPYSYALAGMIGTEALMQKNKSRTAQDFIKQLLAKKEVKDALIAQGIDPIEAKKRIDSLTEDEASRLAEAIEKQPAGGDPFGVIVGASLFVFVVLLITDILGYTDVFPFVKKR